MTARHGTSDHASIRDANTPAHAVRTHVKQYLIYERYSGSKFLLYTLASLVELYIARPAPLLLELKHG